MADIIRSINLEAEAGDPQFWGSALGLETSTFIHIPHQTAHLQLFLRGPLPGP